MYERSAIILEKYYNNMFGFDKKENLKTIYKDFKYTIEEIQKYHLKIDFLHHFKYKPKFNFWVDERIL